MNKTMQNKVTELPMADSLITEATEKTARTPVRVSGFDLEEIGQQAGKEILLQGSVYKLRRMSGFAFVLLRTGRHVIQCVYSSEFSRFGMEELVEESCVRVRALVASEERSRLGWELRLLELQVLSVPAQPMPIVINQKKVDTSLENLLDYRMLTLRNEKQRAIFKIQEGLCQGFRSFLQEQHFTEIHSPKIVEAGAEGGANIFSLDYFGRQAYLAQSPQFYKQMMVGVFERVYEVGPVFRAEKHDTSRHLNEYTGVDFEMGYIESFEEIMEMEEGMIQAALAVSRRHVPRNWNCCRSRPPKKRAWRKCLCRDLPPGSCRKAMSEAGGSKYRLKKPACPWAASPGSVSGRPSLWWRSIITAPWWRRRILSRRKKSCCANMCGNILAVPLYL